MRLHRNQKSNPECNAAYKMQWFQAKVRAVLLYGSCYLDGEKCRRPLISDGWSWQNFATLKAAQRSLLVVYIHFQLHLFSLSHFLVLSWNKESVWLSGRLCFPGWPSQLCSLLMLLLLARYVHFGHAEMFWSHDFGMGWRHAMLLSVFRRERLCSFPSVISLQTAGDTESVFCK